MFRFSLIAACFWAASAIANPCSDYRLSIEQTFEAALKLAAEKAERNIRLGIMGSGSEPAKILKRAGEVYAEAAGQALLDRLKHLELAQKVCP